MHAGYYEEGDSCPKCRGELGYPKVENCSCHINPPCSACTNNSLSCENCGWKEEAPLYRDVIVSQGLSMREYKPRPLDNTKIDYRIKLHSSSSQLCEGVYPPGTTIEQVRQKVNGTFGGRFEKFEGGVFKFIAYTD